MSVVKLPADAHGNTVKTNDKGKTEFANKTIRLTASLYGTNEHGSLIIVGRAGTPVSEQLLKRGLKDKTLSYDADFFHRKNRRVREIADKEARKRALANIEQTTTALPPFDANKVTFIFSVDKPKVDEKHREAFEKDLDKMLEGARNSFGEFIERLAGKYLEKPAGSDGRKDIVPSGAVVGVDPAKVENEPVKPFQTTKAHVLAAQEFLTEKEFFKGEISGKMSDDFRESLKVWQAKNGLEETGTLNEVTFKSLGIEPKEKAE